VWKVICLCGGRYEERRGIARRGDGKMKISVEKAVEWRRV